VVVVSINSNSNGLVILCEFDFWHKWNPIVGFILFSYIFGYMINKSYKCRTAQDVILQMS